MQIVQRIAQQNLAPLKALKAPARANCGSQLVYHNCTQTTMLLHGVDIAACSSVSLRSCRTLTSVSKTLGDKRSPAVMRAGSAAGAVGATQLGGTGTAHRALARAVQTAAPARRKQMHAAAFLKPHSAEELQACSAKLC